MCKCGAVMALEKLELIKEAFDSEEFRGFEFLSGFRVIGESGVEHEFQFVVKHGSSLVAVSFIDEVNDVDMLVVLAKKLDTKIPQIIVCRKVNGVSREIASENKVPIVKWGDQGEFRREVMKFL